MEQQQVQARARKRRKREAAKLEFEAGKVFDPREAKADEFQIDLESARYTAQKGQGGDRRA